MPVWLEKLLPKPTLGIVGRAAAGQSQFCVPSSPVHPMSWLYNLICFSSGRENRSISDVLPGTGCQRIANSRFSEATAALVFVRVFHRAGILAGGHLAAAAVPTANDRLSSRPRSAVLARHSSNWIGGMIAVGIRTVLPSFHLRSKQRNF